jgi:cytochrome c554/c'-like protein
MRMSVNRVLPWIPAAVVLGGFALQAFSDSGVEGARQLSRRSASGAASVRTVHTSEHIGSVAPRYVGAGSCAASNCHGGTRVGSVTAGSEHSIWIRSDPHANAHATLYTHESRQIAEKLGLPSAHTAAVCLNCHALNPDPQELAFEHRHTIQDGVSCESCHGAAEHWLEPHKRFDWKTRSDDFKTALGFTMTKDSLTRTRLCVECHVGSPGRDVNHDLLAAGHPRLHFEMSAYQANMPRHWSLAKEQARSPALEARLWSVGQVVTAEAALRLLEHRAARADATAERDGSPWPELAEYACYACHHDLSEPSWRQKNGFRGRPGELPWSVSRFSLLSGLTGDLTGDLSGTHESLEAGLREVQREMGRSLPSRELVARQARQLSLMLDQAAEQANRGSLSDDVLQHLMLRLTREGGELLRRDWESASQVYLAVAAVQQSRMELRGAPTLEVQQVLDELRTLRDLLQFPRDSEANRYDSPKDFDKRMNDLAASWERIRKAIDREPAEPKAPSP